MPFDPWGGVALLVAALASALLGATLARRAIGRRLESLAARLDAWEDARDLLTRLPEGRDEVGRIAAAFNRLLARMTSQEGEAIDQGRELEATQRALELAEELGEKQHELEARLRERTMLFEVLRESTESQDLTRVLSAIVERVGPALRLRELVVLLREPEGGYRASAAWGFDEGANIVGRAVARPSAGPWATDRGLLVIPDLSRAPGVVIPVREFSRDGSFAAVPIAHRGDEIGVLALTRPADDPLGEVEARYLEAVADQAALAIRNAQLVERLEALATHDELTGLPNRRLFGHRLDRAISRSTRYGTPVSVLALDLDHFKHLNDRCGHAAGDAALEAVAEVLRVALREPDTPARVGGEELSVLLPETDLAGAREVAEKLRARVAAIDTEGADGQPLGHLSVSIGVATRRDAESAEALLARADDALYEAKRSGRDRVMVAPRG